MDKLARNKATVTAFYEQMFNACDPVGAVKNYVGNEYVQHTPHVETGKQGVIVYFARMAREHPGIRVTIHKTFAEGDHVILHCQQYRPPGLRLCGHRYFSSRYGGENRGALGRFTGNASVQRS